MDKISFEIQAVRDINDEIARFPEVETGGALLGIYNEKDNVFIVNKIIDAGPKAIRTRFDFKCDLEYTDMMIDRAVANSSDHIQYLGEWHTHPQVYPYPSDTDLHSLHKMSISYKSKMILVIFGFLDFKLDQIQNQSIGLTYHKKQEMFYELPIIYP